MAALTHSKLLDWLVPALLSAAVGLLSYMAKTMTDVSERLAVGAAKIAEHERRLQILEEYDGRLRALEVLIFRDHKSKER